MVRTKEPANIMVKIGTKEKCKKFGINLSKLLEPVLDNEIKIKEGQLNEGRGSNGVDEKPGNDKPEVVGSDTAITWLTKTG